MLFSEAVPQGLEQSKYAFLQTFAFVSNFKTKYLKVVALLASVPAHTESTNNMN
jgi:hypothetical protein